MSIKQASYPPHVTPDVCAVDVEEILETLGRLEQLALKLKGKACRGDDDAACDLVVMKDTAYTLLAEMLESSR